MSNSSTYKFVYENITDATQIDSSVEEMDLTTEYKAKLWRWWMNISFFARSHRAEKSKNKSIECRTEYKEEKYVDKDAVMKSQSTNIEVPIEAILKTKLQNWDIKDMKNNYLLPLLLEKQESMKKQQGIYLKNTKMIMKRSYLWKA